MTNKQEKLLADFELRMRQLLFLCDSLKKQNVALQEELKMKNQRIEFLDANVKQLKTQYDNLQFVKTLSSGNEEEVKAAKQRLSKLVRDVDKCIALLRI